MLANRSIAVVVPAFNEERLIIRTLETVPQFVDKIVVIDDASQDRTCERVERYIAEGTNQTILLVHETNEGVGGAIATGYKWCRDHEIDVAVVMAGDAQMDPADLPTLLDPVLSDRADYTKGNRLFTGDAWNQIPRIRYLGNSAMSLLTKIASGYWNVADSQCGYTAINLKMLKLINWDQMYKRYGQPNDLLVRLNLVGCRVCDVPVRPVYDIGEESGIKPLRLIPKLSRLLLQLFLWRMVHRYIIRDFHPLVFFYLFGALFFFPGIAFGVGLLLFRLLSGPVAATSALFAVLFVISGLQLLLFGMWFDMEYNRELRVRV